MVAPAHILPQYISLSVIKLVKAKGAVLATILVKISANKNSFQAKIKQSIAVAAMPGLANGKIIFQSACIREHPSIIADSSNSSGISIKKARIIHIARGRLKVV